MLSHIASAQSSQAAPYTKQNTEMVERSCDDGPVQNICRAAVQCDVEQAQTLVDKMDQCRDMRSLRNTLRDAMGVALQVDKKRLNWDLLYLKTAQPQTRSRYFKVAAGSIASCFITLLGAGVYSPSLAQLQLGWRLCESAATYPFAGRDLAECISRRGAKAAIVSDCTTTSAAACLIALRLDDAKNYAREGYLAGENSLDAWLGYCVEWVRELPDQRQQDLLAAAIEACDVVALRRLLTVGVPVGPTTATAWAASPESNRRKFGWGSRGADRDVLQMLLSAGLEPMQVATALQQSEPARLLEYASLLKQHGLDSAALASVFDSAPGPA